MAITQQTFETIRTALASDTGFTTASGSTTATTGGITQGTVVLTVASASTWSAGHGIRIAGAGIGGGRLLTWVESINGTELTLHSQAATTVVAAAVTHDDRFVIAANQIKPASGSLPVVFPCCDIRMSGAEGSDFNDSSAGEVYIYLYYQSEPGSTGQPLTVLNMMADRVKDLLHKKENNISNAAVRIQLMREAYKSGIIPEEDISETTHSQAIRYKYMSNIA